MDGKWEILPFTFNPPCKRFYVLSQNTSFETKHISLLEGNNVPNVCVNIDIITVHNVFLYEWDVCDKCISRNIAALIVDCNRFGRNPFLCFIAIY